MNAITKTIGIGIALASTAIAAAQRDDHDNRGGRDGNDDRVFMDGVRLHFKPEERPFWAHGTMLVPFRATAAQIGAKSGRTPDGDRITLEFGPKHVEYKQGHMYYRINGVRLGVAAASVDRGGILFVPIAIFTNATMNHLKFDRRGDREGN